VPAGLTGRQDVQQSLHDLHFARPTGTHHRRHAHLVLQCVTDTVVTGQHAAQSRSMRRIATRHTAVSASAPASSSAVTTPIEPASAAAQMGVTPSVALVALMKSRLPMTVSELRMRFTMDVKPAATACTPRRRVVTIGAKRSDSVDDDDDDDNDTFGGEVQ
jgi:hypothetical protein